MSTNSKGTALVTGASSGIGAVYADRLARRGYDLILVARNRERLESLAKRLTEATGRSVKVILADLGNKADLARVEQLLRSDATVTMLVNNAGVGVSGELASADPDALENMVYVNVVAPTRLAQAAIPGFVARGRGALINISSIVAVAPELFNGCYGGTKAYLLALSVKLREELADTGIRVQVVMPGLTRTEIFEKAGVDVASLPPENIMEVDAMVDAALVGLDHGEFATIPSLPDIADWEAYEATRKNMHLNLSHRTPARRYSVSTSAAG